jgi:predicted GH43/DUF377 family glycosyl hydrolase
VIGAYLYHKWDVKAPRTLRRKDGLYWTLYGCYPKQGGYEMRPGQEGLASSKDGLVWERAWPEQTLSVYQKDVKEWEKDCIYQPWLIDVDGKYYCFYNAAHGAEQSGFATSHNLINWTRYPGNPVIRNRPLWYDDHMASDPKVFWDGDHWSMFYFGGGRGGASIMYAGSTDLEHWTADRDPLYKPGGNPHGLDRQFAHKVALVWNPQTETFYMFYCAVGSQGRCIALLTSKPLA